MTTMFFVYAIIAPVYEQNHLDVETIHQIKKMELQLDESIRIYESISESHLEKADSMLTEIIETMEANLEEIFTYHNEEELKKLEKILLQQKV